MRAVSLLAFLALLLAGCRDQDPVEPIPIHEPSFYNAAGSYWQVTKLADTNDHTCDADCSLREAIEDAASGDEIRFGVTGTITLTATLQINKNLTITGPGAAQLTVSGDGLYGVFSIAGAGVAAASVSGLTIADGVSNSGGGIHYNSSGTLTISDCVVRDNRAVTGAGIATYGYGTVSITGSTISGNIATGSGGGMYAYGTILTLDRSTFSGNTAALTGGGARFQLGSTTILNSTISGNTADNGGGIYRFRGTTHVILSTITDNNATAATGSGGVALYSGDSYTYVRGSIIWGNTRSGTTAVDVGGAAAGYNSVGYNLIGAGGGAARFDEATDRTGVTGALLGALQLNGPGTTETHALLAGSPAIDAGTCTTDADVPVPTDQRGVTRPQPGGGPCDIGAYELRGGNLGLLMEDVEALGPDGTATLNLGQTNSLLVSLDVVLRKLESGQSHVALNNLRAFIDKVETFIADGVLTSEVGQPLIDAAEQIIAAIEGM